MTTLNVVDCPKNITSNSTYTTEELLTLLLKNLEYNIEIEEFSDEENNHLIKHWKNDYDRLNSLIK